MSRGKEGRRGRGEGGKPEGRGGKGRRRERREGGGKGKGRRTKSEERRGRGEAGGRRDLLGPAPEEECLLFLVGSIFSGVGRDW
jgi:hypothetical protein